MKTPEHDEQVCLFQWAKLATGKYPQLKLLEGSLNGVHLSKAQAAKAKAAGMLKGQHDIRLPVARGGYIGLSVELKVGRNKPTEEQIEIGELLEIEGWYVRYCWGWAAAQEEITNYLNRPKSIVTCSQNI